MYWVLGPKKTTRASFLRLRRNGEKESRVRCLHMFSVKRRIIEESCSIVTHPNELNSEFLAINYFLFKKDEPSVAYFHWEKKGKRKNNNILI